MTPRLLLTLLGFGLTLAGPLHAAPAVLLHETFETGLSAAWTPREFSGQTRYRVVADGTGHVLRADSRAAASGLVYEIDYDPVAYPKLSWRWKIDGIIAKGDAQTRAGDDYAARLYVIFPHWFFPKTRTLNYIWANRLPKGELLPNAYTGNAMMIAVESGPERAGQWVRVERDIVADFRRAFGEDPPRVGAIAIMTDTDNTAAEATARYDDIVISTE